VQVERRPTLRERKGHGAGEDVGLGVEVDEGEEQKYTRRLYVRGGKERQNNHHSMRV